MAARSKSRTRVSEHLLEGNSCRTKQFTLAFVRLASTPQPRSSPTAYRRSSAKTVNGGVITSASLAPTTTPTSQRTGFRPKSGAQPRRAGRGTPGSRSSQASPDLSPPKRRPRPWPRPAPSRCASRRLLERRPARRARHPRRRTITLRPAVLRAFRGAFAGRVQDATEVSIASPSASRSRAHPADEPPLGVRGL